MRNVVAFACVVGAVCALAPTKLAADWYDDFTDGSYWNDPNYTFDWYAPPPEYGGPGSDPNAWDIDNPYWTFYPLASSYGVIECVTTQTGVNFMRIYSQPNPLAPQYSFLGATVDDEDSDPNTSTSYFDDSTSHYLLLRMLYPGAEPDPNDPTLDRGSAMLLLHANPANWYAFVFFINFDDKIPPWNKDPNIDPNDYYEQWGHGWWNKHEWGTHHADLVAGEGTDGRNFRRVWIDPNGVRELYSDDPNTSDPNDTTWLEPPEGGSGITRHRDPNYDDPKWYGVNLDDWERQGFWMLLQFDLDPNYPNKPGDPNGKYLKGAIWNGDKYAWDGEWLLEGELSTNYWTGGTDPLYWYSSKASGICGIASASDTEYLNGHPSEVAYGDFEVRTGVFWPVARTLTVKLMDCCALNIEPNLAHPDGGDKRRYTLGTAVVLDAIVPCGNKSFKKWTVKGPNQSDDPNYLIVTDTNEVLYLTMDGDYLVKAACKCGGGTEPFASVVLILLGLGVALRRMR